jgi:hypothetical protein
LEDPFDAFYMLFHSLPIIAVVAADMALMLAYNVCGMEVTNNLSAVARVIIETLRTLFVWLCDLILFYIISSGRLGEPWTPYSYLQAAGFALTVAGTVIYNYEHLAADYARSHKVAARAAIDDVPSAAVVAGAALASPPRKAAVAAAAVAGAEDCGLHASQSHPLDVGGRAMEEGEEYDSDASEEEEAMAVGSFVGSASHGSFLAGGSFPSSLRKRSVG